MTRPGHNKTVYLVELALLIAIELIFAFTPLGYLPLGIAEITFMTIPIAVAAMMLGPTASLALGILFGATSFAQCFMGSPFGVLIAEISPWRAFILCMIPRALMGWICGLVFAAFSKKEKKGVLAYTLTSLSAPLLNTLFFVTGFFLLYRNATLNFETPVDIATMGLADVFMFLAGINGIVEAVVCTVIATAIGMALSHIKK